MRRLIGIGPAALAGVAVLLALSAGRAAAEVETASTAIRSSATSSTGGGLFSGSLDPTPEPDAMVPEGGLFSGSLDPAPLPGTAPGFVPSLTWSLRLGTTLALDTSFDRRGEHVFEVGVYGRLALHAEVGPHLSIHVLPSFTQISAIDREGGHRAALDLQAPEAYLALRFDAWRLRIGTLVHNWGSTDIVTPNDILNPLDLRRSLVAAQDGARIPVLGAEATLLLSPLTLRAVVQPFFTSSRFYLSGWDTGFAPLIGAQGVVLPDLDGVLGRATADRVGDEILVVDRPSESLDHLTLGLRSTLSLGDLELSGTFVWSYEPLPRLYLDPDLGVVGSAVLDAIAQQRPIDFFDPTVGAAFGRLQEKLERQIALIDGTYPRRTVLGIDATYALDPFLLKLDAAYTVSRTHYSQTFVPVGLPSIDAVLGLEYVRGETLQIELELVALATFDVPASIRLAVLEARETGAGEERVVIVPGAALAGRWVIIEDALSFELLAAATFTRRDLVLAPQLRYRLSDHHQLRLGGLLVEGEPDGYGGAYTHNDQVFVGYQWSP